MSHGRLSIESFSAKPQITERPGCKPSNSAVLLYFLHVFLELARFSDAVARYAIICLTIYMNFWDANGQAHLESLHSELADLGVIKFIRDATSEVWRINRDRHEPDEAHDDAFTLSLLSYRNLDNRLLTDGPSNGQLQAAGVSVEKVFGSTLIRTPRADVRVVKVPHKSGINPVFESDFDWTASENRQAAAIRNRTAYAPPPHDPNVAPLFDIAIPDAAEAAARCREVFLVWGAELETGLTAGWLGLPTTDTQHWIAVTPVWRDESPAQNRSVTNGELASDDGSAFGNTPIPVPSLTLKPRRKEGDAKL